MHPTHTHSRSTGCETHARNGNISHTSIAAANDCLCNWFRGDQTKKRRRADQTKIFALSGGGHARAMHARMPQPPHLVSPVAGLLVHTMCVNIGAMLCVKGVWDMAPVGFVCQYLVLHGTRQTVRASDRHRGRVRFMDRQRESRGIIIIVRVNTRRCWSVLPCAVCGRVRAHSRTVSCAGFTIV